MSRVKDKKKAWNIMRLVTVAKLTIVLISIAAPKNWYLFQLDVHNALTHGDRHKKVYMTLRFRLYKSLYGLKQAFS